MILFKKGNIWYNSDTNKPFVGVARVNGYTYRFTKNGEKILLTKESPNKQRIISHLWEMENPRHYGYKAGKYYPFKTSNGNEDIGPGIDMSKQTVEFRNRARKGLRQNEIDGEVTQRVDGILKHVNQALSRYSMFPDTISPQIKEGLVDMQYQVGDILSYPKLLTAVAHGDLNSIHEQSKVFYKNNRTNKMTYDKSRHDSRKKKYFHYSLGGTIKASRFPSLTTMF